MKSISFKVIEKLKSKNKDVIGKNKFEMVMVY